MMILVDADEKERERRGSWWVFILSLTIATGEYEGISPSDNWKPHSADWLDCILDESSYSYRI